MDSPACNFSSSCSDSRRRLRNLLSFFEISTVGSASLDDKEISLSFPLISSTCCALTVSFFSLALIFSTPAGGFSGLGFSVLVFVALVDGLGKYPGGYPEFEATAARFPFGVYRGTSSKMRRNNLSCGLNDSVTISYLEERILARETK